MYGSGVVYTADNLLTLQKSRRGNVPFPFPKCILQTIIII